MNQKQAKVVREAVGAQVSEKVKMDGYEFAGFTSEGVAFTNGEETFVVRTIVKSETFDLNEAIRELAEKEKTAREKAEAKAKAKAKAEAKETKE